MNSNNILMLPGGAASSTTGFAGGPPSPEGEGKLAVREIDDPDLMVNFVERHPGHVQRRKDRKDAMRRKAVRAQEDRDQQLRDLAMVSQFSVLGVLVVLGLAL